MSMKYRVYCEKERGQYVNQTLDTPDFIINCEGVSELVRIIEKYASIKLKDYYEMHNRNGYRMFFVDKKYEYIYRIKEAL